MHSRSRDVKARAESSRLDNEKQGCASPAGTTLILVIGADVDDAQMEHPTHTLDARRRRVSDSRGIKSPNAQPAVENRRKEKRGTRTPLR